MNLSYDDAWVKSTLTIIRPGDTLCPSWATHSKRNSYLYIQFSGKFLSKIMVLDSLSFADLMVISKEVTKTYTSAAIRDTYL